MKKTAIVTGSSRGIGFAIAKQLGLDGCNIVMVATGPQEKNQHALDELKAMGIDCAYVQANIGSTDDRKKILDGALAAFGRVDILVNNAGVAPKVRADLLDMSEESFDYVVGINTKGNMFLTQLVANQMIKQEPLDGRKGVIVNVSSCSAAVSSTNRGEYCVSKAGVSMLTTLYADRLAAEGILVNEVRPGVIATDMTSKVQGKYDALIEKGTFPIARWGTPEDVAGAVSLLCMAVLLVNYLCNEHFISEYKKGQYVDSTVNAVLGFTQPHIYHYNLGDVYYSQGDYEGAEQEFRKALEKKPGGESDCKTRVNLALSIVKQIDPESVTKENLDEVIDILEGAKDILIENDCAHRDDEDGHYEDAQTLKDEIDAFEEQLRKQTEEQDQKGDQDPNDQKDQGSDDENEEDTEEPQPSDKEEEIRKQLDAIQGDSLDQRNQEMDAYETYKNEHDYYDGRTW